MAASAPLITRHEHTAGRGCACRECPDLHKLEYACISLLLNTLHTTHALNERLAANVCAWVSSSLISALTLLALCLFG